MGGPGAGGVINTLRIRQVAQRLGQGAANYSDALSQTAAARGRGDAGGERATGGRVGGRRLCVLRMRTRPQRRGRVGEQAPAEIPQGLIGQFFEIDADDADALWALDQPPGSLNTAT